METRCYVHIWMAVKEVKFLVNRVGLILQESVGYLCLLMVVVMVDNFTAHSSL